MSNFLQEHYNGYRQSGGGHGAYVAINDLGDETAIQLRTEYDRKFPESVPEEVQRAFREKLTAEAREAERRDDLRWLTGTGRYGQ